MIPRLIILDESFPPREIVPRREPLDVGRDLARDIVLNHRSVSRRHAVIRRVEDKLVLEDTGSTFGTFVNRQPVPRGGSVIVHDGDVLQLGSVRMICRFEPEERDARSMARAAAFAAQANARVLLLKGDQVQRWPLAGPVTVIGTSEHCDVRLEGRDGPPEQALIRAAEGRFWLEPRSREAPIFLNEQQTVVEEPTVLPSNSAVVVHQGQFLFLYDFEEGGRRIKDPLAGVSRRRLMSFVAWQKGLSAKALRTQCKDYHGRGQNLGERLVGEGVVTPLFWRVLCSRLLESEHRRSTSFFRRWRGA